MKKLIAVFVIALSLSLLLLLCSCNNSHGGTGEDGGEQSNEGEITISLHPVASPVTLAKPVTVSYLSAARDAYASPAYSDYTGSIISYFPSLASDFADRPDVLTLSFEGDESFSSYTLLLSLTPDFSASVRVFSLGKETSLSVTNLYTGATYYWRVEGKTANGEAVVSDTSAFTTEANAVRWIAVDGIRNVRDLGGWTGLRQGMVFRGSEMNLVGNHGLEITKEGRRVMTDELGIKTDLDLRSALNNGSVISPLGSKVSWINHPIGNFLSAFDGTYLPVLKEFANPMNYPIYMHCWGGADRTGTVAMILEGLCGVAEEDISADLELTSFSTFGYRYRYDNGEYLFASTLAKIKTDYEGDTLKEKFESYALSLGLTRAEISNIQSLLCGTGVTFAFNTLEDIFLHPASEIDTVLNIHAPKGQTVTAVSLEGNALAFGYQSGVLTISSRELKNPGISTGVLLIEMSDGQTLATDFSLLTE